MKKTLYDFEDALVELIDQAINDLSTEHLYMLLDYISMTLDDFDIDRRCDDGEINI